MKVDVNEEDSGTTGSSPLIVDYIASQGWDGLEVEIFMGLKEGTLESLVESGGCLPASVSESVFPQMLQALDCLAWKGIIHRDLGDLGLCNNAVDAATFAGSPIYMAPEMFRKGGQTSKLDVWSLFVTMLWTLNVRGFRQRWTEFKSTEDAQEAVLFAASKVDTVSKIQEMAIVDPDKRASAAQMLIKCYNGVGLSTPRNHVPALTSSPSHAIAAVRAPAAACPALRTRTAQTKPRGLQKNMNIFAAAAQYRIEKARGPLQAQQFRRLHDLRLKTQGALGTAESNTSPYHPTRSWKE